MVNDESADLSVRAWRYSYNANGIIEIPNKLDGQKTALVVVHPWAVGNEQYLQTPTPNGSVFFGTKENNQIYLQHLRNVLTPFIKSVRGKVECVMYSLPGKEDDIRKNMYRSISNNVVDDKLGKKALLNFISNTKLTGNPIKSSFLLDSNRKVYSYFNQFDQTGDSSYYDAEFWEIPMPLSSYLDIAPQDIVIYDDDGYEKMKEYLESQGIRNILLCGYSTDMCYRSTTAGYENLRKDFNVFLVGDATLATFPAQDSPAAATKSALCLASVSNLITQISWINEIQ